MRDLPGQGPIERYVYPRLVGGKAAKKKAPMVPGGRDYLEICVSDRPTHSYTPENATLPPADLTFRTETYVKRKTAFGPGRMMTFWAHYRLGPEDAFDQLMTDIFTRCGVRREN